MKVLVFGNPLVAQDSIALEMVPGLRERFPAIEFKEFDPTENLEKEGRDLVILDSAMGITEVTLIEDAGSLELSNRYSMHDLDLPITLKLLKKVGAIDSVRIIAVPQKYPLGRAIAEAVPIISSLLSGNASRSSCRGRKPG
ncbi:MAG: hypothetical protein V1827_03535 [Candidatus Micrarchaeota archaeon]